MRGNYERRIAALEDRRDRIVNRLANRYFDRAEAVLGDQYDAWLNALADGGDPPAGLQAQLTRDAEITRIAPVLNLLENWRQYIECAITLNRRRRAE